MGLEVITQPQLFTKPITALGGYYGINEAWPLLTTYQSWTSTASVNASAFPIPGTWTMIDEPGSFIVTVGGVYQPSSEYTVSRTFRTLTFNSLVSAGVEIAAQQLATAAPSAQNFNYIQSVSASIQSLSARTGFFNTLLVTNLTGLSTVVNIIDVRISEVSGFRSTGDVQIDGNVSVSRNIYLSGNLYLDTTDQIVTPTINATNATVTNLTGTNLTSTNATVTNLTALSFVLTDNGSLIGATSATSISIGTLSARKIDLVHTPANDGVDPILDIGETTTDGFSGIRIRYEENSNRLLVQTIAPSLTSNSVIIDRATGRVGVSAVPNEALTVQGNISATGNALIFGSVAANNLPNNLVLNANRSPLSVTTSIAYFDPTVTLTLSANRTYEIVYDLYFSSATSTFLRYVLSADKNFTNAVCNYITSQSGAGGITVVGTPQMGGALNNTSTINLPPFSVTAGVSSYSNIKALIETSDTTTFLLAVSGNAAGTVTPLRGSKRTTTLIS